MRDTLTRRARLCLPALCLLAGLGVGCGNNGTGTNNNPTDMNTPDMADMAVDMDMETDDSVPDTTAPVVMITSGMLASEEGAYTLEGSVMDDVGVASLSYKLGDGAAQDIPITGGTFKVDVTLPADPTTVRVTARDAAGNEGQAELEVKWTPPQVIEPSFTVSTMPFVHENLVFDATGTSNPKNKNLTYTWDFGDGKGQIDSALVRAGHRYKEPGDYTVKLTIKADDGETVMTDRMVTVSIPQGIGTATVFGEIIDDDNGALEGVKISDQDGNELGKSDAQGRYEITIPRDVSVTLRLERPDYTEQIIRVRVPATKTKGYALSMMKLRNAPLYLEDAALGGEVYGENGARLEFPPNAIVDAETGDLIKGTIAVLLTPVDMTARRKSRAFPGGFTGFTPAGDEPEIASHGVMEVELRQDGRKLQVAPGKKVTIDIPSPATAPGDVIPLWSLDPDSGYWDQEGTGTVVRNNVGLVLRAEVSHFSWWNSDVVLSDGYVEGQLTFTAGGQPWAAAGAPRISVIAPQTPRRNINTRLGTDPGEMPTLALPMPKGLESEVEAIDADDNNIYYGLGYVAYDQNNQNTMLDLKAYPKATAPLLPLGGTATTHTLTDANSSYFFRAAGVMEGESLKVNVLGLSSSGRVIIRDATGAPVAEKVFSTTNTNGAVLYSPPTAGDLFVHVRPDNKDTGDFEIRGEVVTDEIIQPGQTIPSETLPLGDTKTYVIKANRGKHIAAQIHGRVDPDASDPLVEHPQPIALQSWTLNAESPSGQSIGELARGDSASPMIQFTPNTVPRSNGFRLRARSFDGTTPDRSFAITFGAVKDFPGEFVNSTKREYLGELTAHGETHRFDFIGKPDHHVHVYLKNTTTGATTPLLLGGGSALARSVFYDQASKSAHLKTKLSTSSNRGTIWVTYPGRMPTHKETDPMGVARKVVTKQTYRLVVEQSPEVPNAVVGTCTDATMEHLVLAQAAVETGGSIRLCDGEHQLIEPLLNIQTLSGPMNGQDSTTIRLVDDPGLGGALFSANSGLQPAVATPVTVEDVTFIQNSSSAMYLNTEQEVILRNVSMTLQPSGTASSAAAVSVGNGAGKASPLRVENVKLSGWNTGVRVTGARDVTIQGVTFDGPEFANSIVQVQTSEGDTVVRDVTSPSAGANDVKFQSPISLATSGSVLVEGSTIRQAGTGAGVLITAQGAATPTTVVARGNTILMTSTTTSTSASIYEPISVSLRGTQQDVTIEHNMLGTTNNTSQTRGVTIKTSGSTTALTATVRGNVLWNFRNASSFPNLDRFSRFDIVHNSALIRDASIQGAFDMSSIGAANVVFQNNAVAFDAASTHAGVRLGPNVSLTGANNLFYNTGDAFSRPANATTTGDQTGVDPMWDVTWNATTPTPLKPQMGSPLINGGVAHTSTPATDISGQMCPAGASVDIGPYEQ